MIISYGHKAMQVTIDVYTSDTDIDNRFIDIIPWHYTRYTTTCACLNIGQDVVLSSTRSIASQDLLNSAKLLCQ